VCSLGTWAWADNKCQIGALHPIGGSSAVLAAFRKTKNKISNNLSQNIFPLIDESTISITHKINRTLNVDSFYVK
jgi:hypothetical protein